MTELDSLWEAIQNSFRQSKSQVTFDTLIAPAKPLSLSQNQLEVEVPTKVHRDFWEKNLKAELKQYAKAVTDQEIEPHFVLEGEVGHLAPCTCGMVADYYTAGVGPGARGGVWAIIRAWNACRYISRALCRA